jgi:hypothetical protein
MRAFRDPPVSSARLLRQAPKAIADEIRGRTILYSGRSRAPKYHHRFILDQKLVLHVYRATQHPELRRSIPDRRQLHKEASFTGIPQLRCAEDDGELIWIIEDRLLGAPGPMDDERSTLRAVEWLCQFAALTGPPLRTTLFWETHKEPSIEAAPEALRPRLAQAWSLIGDTQARPLHGDAQPKNFVFGRHGVGLVDWEGVWCHGLPGHDAMFLATMTGSRTPTRVVPDLLLKIPHAWEEPLRHALHRVGYRRDQVDSALLVMLSLWSLGEVRRHRRQPRSNQPTPFLDLLGLAGAALTG